MLERIWTISTILSFSRIFLLAPLAYFLFADVPNNREWAACVLIVAAATDFLDGYLARRLHQVTDFGKIIDPLADKIVVGVGSILLVSVGALPLWYVVLAVVRDLLILLGGWYIKSKKNIISQSNWPGKITVTLIALVMLVSVLAKPSLEGIRQLLIWSSIFMMALSLWLYMQRLFIGNAIAQRSQK